MRVYYEIKNKMILILFQLNYLSIKKRISVKFIARNNSDDAP